MKKTVITFGRLNPPTIGHQKLVDKVKSEAKKRGAMPHVYLSHSQDNKKNPLDYDTKISIAKRTFGPSITKSPARNIIEILKELEKMGHTEVTIIVGSDRLREFENLVTKYNGKEYNFDKIDFVSAGDRDPDSTGVSGMSASKLRAAAQAGDYDLFKKGSPKNMSEKDIKQIYDKIRSAMERVEEKEFDDDDFFFTDAELERFIDSVNLDALDEQRSDLDENFEEFLEEVLLERKPLTIQQRIAIGRRMKRLQPRIRRRKEMLKKRMATPEKLKVRARKAAIQLLRKRFAGKQGQNYASLTPSSKIAVDRIIQKKMPMVDKLSMRLLPKIRKAEQERLKKSREVKENQDSDIKNRKGSQPAEYHSGLKKSTKIARDRHFKKYADKPDGDGSSYKPAPGDSGVKTRPSVHTKKYKQQFGENLDAAFNRFIKEEYIEEKALEGLKKKAEKSGISYSILKKVYDRGMAAWKSGHRPGTTPQQWAYARVNSFLTGGKTRETADADLWKTRNEETKTPLQRLKDFDKSRTAAGKKPIFTDKKKDVKEQDAVKAVKDRIKREKESDKSKHDSMLDRARLQDAQAKNRSTTTESINREFENMFKEEHNNCGTPACCGQCIPSNQVSEAIQFMNSNDIIFSENVYRPLSDKYFEFFTEARELMNKGLIQVAGVNREILESDIGEFGFYENEHVPLDCPLVEEKEPELNKPKRGGPKKFYVYVKDPSTGNIKKVTFGDTTGLKAKINNVAARKSFAARHQCDIRNDKTTASYWACRLPRYAASLGMQVDNPGAFW